VWQALRTELHPAGLEIVTVALDVGGLDAAKPFIEAAKSEHPALIDQAHVLDELLGIVNVPSWIWIDEQGMIVRPPEPAWPGTSAIREMIKGAPLQNLPQYVRESAEEALKLNRDFDVYPAALRDWVANGPASRYVLTPEQVVERSRPRPPEIALAAAHFELGQHLVRAGKHEQAIPHFRQAHRLQPENWTYKRQAWIMVDPMQGPTEHYEGDWLKDIRDIGYEAYYPAFEP
jgi:tetratricopeptide (TPR) repeat protein